VISTTGRHVRTLGALFLSRTSHYNPTVRSHFCLSDSELAEASKCGRTFSVRMPLKRSKAGTLRLLPLGH
jgi:hypothetical protein